MYGGNLIFQILLKNSDGGLILSVPAEGNKIISMEKSTPKLFANVFDSLIKL